MRVSTAGATPDAVPTPVLAARGVTLGYGDRVVCADLSVELPDRGMTAVVGPNGCGKSTLLKALARTLRPRSGQVLLDDRPIGSWPAKQVARRVALLPQNPVVPEAIRVRDLVTRGRFPHRSLLRQWSAADQRAVDEAVAVTGLDGLADRPVAELSGGQRQRVWMAMVLAQDTPVLLLDEPTTFLDLAHQVELLRLCARLAADGRSVVAVLHDLNQAARFADHLVVLRDGRLLAQGPPASVLTADLVERAFGLRAVVVPDPEAGTPMVVPAAEGAHPAGPPTRAPGPTREPRGCSFEASLLGSGRCSGREKQPQTSTSRRGGTGRA